MKSRTGSWLFGFLIFVLSPLSAIAQGPVWQRHMEAGARAYEQGRYAEAQRRLQAALKEAEALASESVHVAETLHGLGVVYSAQDRYADAERIRKRALAISEKILGPSHPDVATALNNLAESYVDQGKDALQGYLN